MARQLEAYEEGWKVDHDEAMRCRDFEENLAVGINIFHSLMQVDVTRRHRIESGREEFIASEDGDMLGWFRWWLRPTEGAMARIRYFEQKFGAVDGAAEFRRCCEEAKEIVTEWKPPVPKRFDGMAAAAIVSHTDVSLTTAEMACALDKVSRPTAQTSVPLGFNPDDCPLF